MVRSGSHFSPYFHPNHRPQLECAFTMFLDVLFDLKIIVIYENKFVDMLRDPITVNGLSA